MGGKWIRSRTKVATDLPAEIRQQVHGLLLDGATYEELSKWLAAKGYEISKSSIGRYGKKFYEVHQRMATYRDQVKALSGEAGEALSLDDVLSQMIQQQLLEKLMAGDLNVVDDPKLIGELARLQRETSNREKLKADLAARVHQAAEEVETIAKKGGLSGDTVERIKSEILGIA